MKTSIKTKKGFTVGELIAVIALIAVLAAVLIPLFVSLNQKAVDNAASADAYKAANQLLVNLLERGDDAKDLVVIKQKDDGLYVYAYCAEDGIVSDYRNNPVTDINGDTFDQKVESLLADLVANKMIEAITPAPAEDNWAHKDQLKTTVTTLGFDADKLALRADYKVIMSAFAPDSTPVDHVCSAETLEKHEGQTADCEHSGWDAYYVCRECGKMYSDENATSLLSELKVTEALGHEWNDGEITTVATCTAEGVKTYTCSRCGETKTESVEKASHKYETKHDDDNHWKECTVCHTKKSTAAHTLSNYYKKNGKYYGTCSCGVAKEINENNTTGFATYKLAMDLNEILAKSKSKNDTMYDAFNYIVKNSDYKDIKSVISAIDSAENILKNEIIVWDQTVDRFAVVTNDISNVTVLYTDKDSNGINGTLKGGEIGYPAAAQLWDVYDDTHKIPDRQVFSIYWAGTQSPFKVIKGIDGQPDYTGWDILYVGFDMGEWTPDNLQVRISVSNGVNDIIVRTNGDMAEMKVGAIANMSHYGKLNKLVLDVLNVQRDGYTYHEYGTVNEVTRQGGTAKDEDHAKLTIYAESGSQFAQSKATIEALGCKVEGKGGKFGN